MLDGLVAEQSNSGDKWGVVRAAEILHSMDAVLAERIIRTCDIHEVDSLVADIFTDSARLWASWGMPEEARKRLNQALEAHRALNWYGPARHIAEAAVVAASFDAEWSEQLATETMALVEPEVGRSDKSEASRLDGILADIVSHFVNSHRNRALKAARWISGGWVKGGNWDSTDGRSGALSVIGLRAADSDPLLAAQLLTECLALDESELRLGRPDQCLCSTGLFQPKEAAAASPLGTAALSHGISYVANEVNYWSGGREWRFFSSPGDVRRRL
jgi:hypothetical protein